MSNSDDSKISRSHEQWARFRFSVIGPLLAAPAAPGQLQEKLQALAQREWRHPISGQQVRFGLSTLQRWYYTALNHPQDPLTALRRKIRSDYGCHASLSAKLAEALTLQFRQHPSWSYQLHADNLAALVCHDPDLGPMASYSSIKRFMKAHGLIKRSRRGPTGSPGAQVAEERFEAREIRSYQSAYVNALWHLDFHHGSRRVLLANARWAYPLLLGVLDDRSRLCCHLQWYLNEGVEDLCHGFMQALCKHARPKALMSDNGSAMVAEEFTGGLQRLGIVHDPTLPFSPYQNGKQESFWGQIEGRLLPMLEGVKDLSLQQLNEATLAWGSLEYNRKVHSELKQTPLSCYLNQKDVGRPCPSTEQLQLAFTREIARRQRRSDGTISLQGTRFEIPSRYGHFEQLTLRFASWDLTRVYLTDPKSGIIWCRLYPQDKQRNAQGKRAPKTALCEPSSPIPPSGVAPLLEQIIQQYAATGLPPAYLPKQSAHSNPNDQTHES